MARIEDFGDHIRGAAKERWQTYRARMRDAPDLVSQPLSKSFPEPPYEKLLEDGLDPWVLAFVRAARDSIPAKPRSRGVRGWARQVGTLRDLCRDLVEERVSRDRLEDILARDDNARLRRDLTTRLDLYLEMGHARSLKNYRLEKNAYTRIDGVPQTPPAELWEVREIAGKGSLARRTVARGPEKDRVIAAFREELDGKAERKAGKPTKFELYRYRDHPGVWIGKKAGRNMIDLECFDDAATARTYLRDNRAALEEKLARLRDLPPERGSENRSRTGPEVRDGHVTPERFAETFGFRGVQFGNYVEGARRQEDLDRAYDALVDLAGAIGCPPRALSLDGSLGLAFGARGKGGRGAAAAHFEPVDVVINLTKTRGAGSLAHEWFHGLDNYLHRRDGGGADYASRSGRPGPASRAMRDLVHGLGDRTGVAARSADLDRTRSTPYFGTPVEIVARSFESWVIDRLERQDVTNDYLANVLPEDIFEAEAALRGQPEGRYPYPRADELAEIDRAFTALLGDRAVREVLDMDDAPEPIHETEDAAPGEDGVEIADYFF